MVTRYFTVMTSNKVPNIFSSTNNSTKDVLCNFIKRINPASHYLNCALDDTLGIAPDLAPTTMKDIRHKFDSILNNTNNSLEYLG